MSTRSKSKNTHATRRRSPPQELSASASSEDGSDHSTPQPSGEDPSSDELVDRVGDDFPYMEPPSKRRRTSHASKPLSHSRSRMRSQGHRRRHKKGIAVARKVAALTARILPIPPAGTVATTVHPALPVAARMIALFATANAGTIITTTHHPVPAVLPAPVVIQAVVDITNTDITNTDITATDSTNRTEPWSAVHSPSHATLDGGLGEVCQF